jgi:hypothetical protein
LWWQYGTLQEFLQVLVCDAGQLRFRLLCMSVTS